MPLNPLYMCSRCRKEFNFNNIKYNEDGALVCLDCLKIKKPEGKKNLRKEHGSEAETVDLICVSCRYKFSVKKGSAKSVKCPYCAKTNLMLIKKYKDEHDLIDDSMDAKYDY